MLCGLHRQLLALKFSCGASHQKRGEFTTDRKVSHRRGFLTDSAETLSMKLSDNCRDFSTRKEASNIFISMLCSPQSKLTIANSSRIAEI